MNWTLEIIIDHKCLALAWDRWTEWYCERGALVLFQRYVIATRPEEGIRLSKLCLFVVVRVLDQVRVICLQIILQELSILPFLPFVLFVFLFLLRLIFNITSIISFNHHVLQSVLNPGYVGGIRPLCRQIDLFKQFESLCHFKVWRKELRPIADLAKSIVVLVHMIKLLEAIFDGKYVSVLGEVLACWLSWGCVIALSKPVPWWGASGVHAKHWFVCERLTMVNIGVRCDIFLHLLVLGNFIQEPVWASLVFWLLGKSRWDLIEASVTSC